MTASCLVTGASGFIGRPVARLLESQGHQVVVLGRSPVAGHRTVLGDLARAELDFRGEAFAQVYHAAGLAHLDPRTDEERERFARVNVEGTRALLTGLERCRELPVSFLMVSTVAVYGVEKGDLLAETTERRALDPYGLSKRQAEDLVQEWGERRGVRTAVVRLPLVVGPGAPGNLRRMAAALAAGRYLGMGNGVARRSMVRVEDVAEILPKAAEAGGVFHLTDGVHPSVGELETALASALGRRAPWRLPMPLAHAAAAIGDVLETVMRAKMPFNRRILSKLTSTLTFSDEKARQELAWRPARVLDSVDALLDGLR
jgi:nucleoside-diphosphate-sugar epimerase